MNGALWRTDHLFRLVDDVGIVQHADGTVPKRATGYCVDDVARLAIVAVGLDRERRDRACSRVLGSALAFLLHAWDPGSPGMHNLMDYGRRWLDRPHTGDHLGRAVWALGTVLAQQPPRREGPACRRLLTAMRPCLEPTDSLRETAFVLLGLARPQDQVVSGLPDLLARLAGRLKTAYDGAQRDGWRWFEDRLTYDNARLPQALIAAGARLGDEALLRCGLSALDWYAEQCTDGDLIRLVGNRWRPASTGTAAYEREGDEQPLDAGALVEALSEAYRQTGRADYARGATLAFEWFLGRNTAGVEVYDFLTGGCRDGLGPDGLSDNEGAESTLAYLQALLALEEAGIPAVLGRSA